MGKKCENCGEEILRKEALFLNGRPYCKDCYGEAEENYQGFDEDYDEDDEEDELEDDEEDEDDD